MTNTNTNTNRRTRTWMDSPAGRLMIELEDGAITRLMIEGQEGFADGSAAEIEPEDVRRIKEWLKAYFRQENPDPKSLSLNPKGTLFQKMVWSILQEIPEGEVLSYQDAANLAAKRMGRESMSPRAVGSAAAKNPILILIPCHRLITSDGRIGGYAAGEGKKKLLLELEGARLKK